MRTRELNHRIWILTAELSYFEDQLRTACQHNPRYVERLEVEIALLSEEINRLRSPCEESTL